MALQEQLLDELATVTVSFPELEPNRGEVLEASV